MQQLTTTNFASYLFWMNCNKKHKIFTFFFFIIILAAACNNNKKDLSENMFSEKHGFKSN